MRDQFSSDARQRARPHRQVLGQIPWSGRGRQYVESEKYNSITPAGGTRRSRIETITAVCSTSQGLTPRAAQPASRSTPSNWRAYDWASSSSLGADTTVGRGASFRASWTSSALCTASKRRYLASVL